MDERTGGKILEFKPNKPKSDVKPTTRPQREAEPAGLDYIKAAKEAIAGLEEDPNDVKRMGIAMKIGDHLVREGKYPEALKVFEFLISQNVRMANIWFQFGFCLHKLARIDEARQAYKTAIEIQPNDFDSVYNLGELLLFKDKQEGEAEAGEMLAKLEQMREQPNLETNQLTKLADLIKRIDYKFFSKPKVLSMPE